MSPFQLTYRAFNDSDLDVVVELDRASSGSSRRGFMEKRLSAGRSRPEAFISIVVLDGSDLIGFGFCHFIEGEYGVAHPTAVLDTLGVRSDWQSRGVGYSIMEHLTTRIRERGALQLQTLARWDQHGLLDFFSRTGFVLQPRLVLECPTSNDPDPTDPEADGIDFESLSLGQALIRSLEPGDIDTVVAVDKKITGRNRHDYYHRKFAEVLEESGIRISLVAENDSRVVGFIMAAVNYGEFGLADTVAVLDTLGVAPDFRAQNIGRALMSQLFLNLRSLRVDKVRTSVAWNEFALNRFLERCGFQPSQHLVLHQPLN